MKSSVVKCCVVSPPSPLCYSTDRQLSLDLVNVGRQRLDFLPMLEHSGTFRETATHTGTFAQEIITLVHHVKGELMFKAWARHIKKKGQVRSDVSCLCCRTLLQRRRSHPERAVLSSSERKLRWRRDWGADAGREVHFQPVRLTVADILQTLQTVADINRHYKQ